MAVGHGKGPLRHGHHLEVVEKVAKDGCLINSDAKVALDSLDGTALVDAWVHDVDPVRGGEDDLVLGDGALHRRVGALRGFPEVVDGELDDVVSVFAEILDDSVAVVVSRYMGNEGVVSALKVSDGFGGDDQANVMAVVAKLPNPCNDLTGEVRIDGRRRDIDTVTDDVGSVFRDDWHALQVRAEHRR